MPARSAVCEAFGRAVRRERALSQEAFAARIGIDRSYFGAIERGEFNVSLGTIIKIAVGLDLRASYFGGRGCRRP